jgi:NAD(P)-dependent dehydrogenase (short-subunit alcohol dehydrogenase family)
MNRWEGRTAVVCDFAGSSTSCEICKDLVNYGLTVLALTTRDGVREFDKLEKELKQKESKGQLISMECDVRYEEHVNPVFRYIGERYGGIDLLINNVNSMDRGMILEDENTESLRKTMQTNIIGLCLVLREAAKLMKQRPADQKNIGHIVNITSAVGDMYGATSHASKPINALYPASK